MYACMAWATSLLYATASTTVRVPLTTSPEAKFSGRVVWPLSLVTSSPPAVGGQTRGGADDGVLGALGDGDDYAVGGVEGVRSGNLREGMVLMLLHVPENCTLVHDFHRLFPGVNGKKRNF